MMHVTRSFLLNDFTDLSRRPKVPHPMVSSHVQKCIQAAEDIMTITDGLAHQGVLIQSFWFTHYVCFCAVLVIYIHTIQQHRKSLGGSSSVSVSPVGSPNDRDKLRQLFSLAESCQQHLVEATRKNCPSRRYGIILEELRQEVHRQIGSNGVSTETQAYPSSGNDTLYVLGEGSKNANAKSVLYDTQTADFMMPPTDLGMNTGDDAGLLESLEGSIWWAQLDSWVCIMLFLTSYEYGMLLAYTHPMLTLCSRPFLIPLMTLLRLTFKHRIHVSSQLQSQIAFNCKYPATVPHSGHSSLNAIQPSILIRWHSSLHETTTVNIL